MARLWRREEFQAAEQPHAAALLADGEIALSGFFDLIRPGSVEGTLQLVPECWRDPALPPGRELFFKVRSTTGSSGSARVWCKLMHMPSDASLSLPCTALQRFLQWPEYSLRPLDFGLADHDATPLLLWLRRHHITANSGWRQELDCFADAAYWALLDCLKGGRPVVAKRRLPAVSVVVNRSWFLLLPVGIIETAQHMYSGTDGHMFRVSACRQAATQREGHNGGVPAGGSTTGGMLARRGAAHHRQTRHCAARAPPFPSLLDGD